MQVTLHYMPYSALFPVLFLLRTVSCRVLLSLPLFWSLPFSFLTLPFSSFPYIPLFSLLPLSTISPLPHVSEVLFFVLICLLFVVSHATDLSLYPFLPLFLQSISSLSTTCSFALHRSALWLWGCDCGCCMCSELLCVSRAHALSCFGSVGRWRRSHRGQRCDGNLIYTHNSAQPKQLLSLCSRRHTRAHRHVYALTHIDEKLYTQTH